MSVYIINPSTYKVLQRQNHDNTAKKDGQKNGSSNKYHNQEITYRIRAKSRQYTQRNDFPNEWA